MLMLQGRDLNDPPTPFGCTHAGFAMGMSATLENGADPTLENEATGSSSSSLPGLGF
jgi:hypothetical protein